MSETPQNPEPTPDPTIPPAAAVPPASPIDYGTPSNANAYTGPAPDKDATTMGMLCHLLAIFTTFLGPLIIWLIKKDSHPFVDDQGKEALNFQITVLIAAAICVPLNFVFCLGAILFLIVMIARLVFTIIATVKANQGVAYRYPLTFRFIK